MWSKKLYIPDYYYKNIQNIPFKMFAKKGIKALFFDLDNTLITYRSKTFDDQTKIFLQKLTLYFKIIILSNATKKRLTKTLQGDFIFIHLNLLIKKPSLKAFNKALKLVNLLPSQVLMIGDQLHTDIKGANKAGINSLLVKPLDRSQESIWTKFNRFHKEKKFLKKFKVQNFELWKEKFEDFEEN